MISAWWLCLIIPFTFTFGYVFGSVMNNCKKADKYMGKIEKSK